jgi:hypothetical protein
MFNIDDHSRKRAQELLTQVLSFKIPLHPEFAWWKERQSIPKRRYGSDYNLYLRDFSDNQTVPPQDLLELLDKFESLVNWLETKPVGQGMTAHEKADIACRLIETLKPNEVSLTSDSFDVTVKGDYEQPLRIAKED